MHFPRAILYWEMQTVLPDHCYFQLSMWGGVPDEAQLESELHQSIITDTDVGLNVGLKHTPQINALIN